MYKMSIINKTTLYRQIMLILAENIEDEDLKAQKHIINILLNVVHCYIQ